MRLWTKGRRLLTKDWAVDRSNANAATATCCARAALRCTRLRTKGHRLLTKDCALDRSNANAAPGTWCARAAPRCTGLRTRGWRLLTKDCALDRSNADAATATSPTFCATGRVSDRGNKNQTRAASCKAIGTMNATA